MKKALIQLQKQLNGELHYDSLHKTIYATDASIYREIPLAVAYPKNKADIQILITFAIQHKTTLIPRTAGTSLAGQCVGNGIVVDVSKHFTQILDFNKQENWVEVQPGVIRDELNLFLKPQGLFFPPETSTANRAMIGGMVGNNSTGTNSIAFGNTRNHVIELEAILSDGSVVNFKPLDKQTFHKKRELHSLEGKLYEHIFQSLSDESVQKEIEKEFPKPEIHRRNTGYAVDELLQNNVFKASSKEQFNFCKLICGSEGTLAFITKIKLNLLPLPPKRSVLLCPHFYSIKESLLAVQKIMPLQPFSCELMDKVIMDCTKENKAFEKYRFFLDGDPESILMVELKANTEQELNNKIAQTLQILNHETATYACPQLKNDEINKAWYLRKAGLGLLANIPGDKKAVAVIEDTAVHINDLANYINEFTEMMEKHHQKAVYYAHAGAGELHLRPILDLKKNEDLALLKKIAWDTAHLVKKYKGSLSGEHGDGRVRASFLPFMLGEKNYQLLKGIKQTWDSNNIFNAGKIIAAKPIDEDLRYKTDRTEPELKTLLNFNDEGGILRLAEKCNGSGDCRKTHLSGGTMCPSYMATKNEKDTTRARANTLREFLTQNNTQREKWNSKEIKEALDLCLSCKACKSECPSNVDMALMKAEYTYQYNKINGTPFRSKLFGNVEKLNKIGSLTPNFTNWVNSLNITKKIMGLAPERTAPKLAKQTLRKWITNKHKTQDAGSKTSVNSKQKTVILFIDEFTNYNDVEIGKKAIILLEKLAYKIEIAPIFDSGRAFLSKGMLEEAKVLANKNVKILMPLISAETPLIGIEPSAILSFRDEYIKLIDNKAYKDSCVAKHSYTIDEFLAFETQKGNISRELFTENHVQIKLHGHCHQKALSEQKYTQQMLSLPKNYHVEILPTGCCGMAGSFGYEKEHYSVSMQVGNLVLFPAVKAMETNEIICAPGTSCRHQIYDGTKRTALHPIEVLYGALK